MFEIIEISEKYSIKKLFFLHCSLEIIVPCSGFKPHTKERELTAWFIFSDCMHNDRSADKYYYCMLASDGNSCISTGQGD